MSLENFLRRFLVNPTDGKIRSDSEGDGHFGARRGVRLHMGIDLECVVGQAVRAPHAGKIHREYLMYNGDVLTGVEIVDEHIISRLGYVDMMPHILGNVVRQGDIVGTAQDVRNRYGWKMTPHVHWEVYVNPEALITAVEVLSHGEVAA